MKATAIAGIITAVALGAAVLVLLYANHQAPGWVNARQVVAAAQQYGVQLKARGEVVPTEVPLEELLASGLLKPQDVQGFAGMKVTVALAVDPQKSQEVLLRARLPSGQEIVALNDGSVQQLQAK